MIIKNRDITTSIITFIQFHLYNCTKDNENRNAFQNQLGYIR